MSVCVRMALLVRVTSVVHHYIDVGSNFPSAHEGLTKHLSSENIS